MARLDVICIGSATLDTIAVVAAYPTEDSRTEASTIITAGGGPAATAAVALARLGVSVGFAGSVCSDAAGEEVRRGLEAEGVDTRWLQNVGDHTGASVVVVGDEGSRTIFTRPASPPADLRITASEAVWMHVDQTGYAAARALGPAVGRLSIDAGNPICALSLVDVDLYAPTLQSLRAAFPGSDQQSFLDAHEAGAHAIVATDGARGAHYSTDGHMEVVPAFPTDVVSTLGAGDVFHGALLAALVRGADLRSATEVASWVAAMSCRGLDGRSTIPYWDEVLIQFPALTTL